MVVTPAPAGTTRDRDSDAGAASARAVVARVAAALQRRRPEDEIVRELVDAGVPMRDAHAVYHAVTEAIRLGVLAAYLNKPPGAAGGRPDDPLTAAAYDAGYAAFSRGSARAALRGLLGVPLVLAVGVALLLLCGLFLSACD